MAGLQNVVFNVPAQWDQRWFQTFVRDVLAKADARNAIGTPGVTVDGTVTSVATIGYATADSGQISANRSFADKPTSTPSIDSYNLNLSQFQRPAPSVAPVDDTQNVLAMEIFS